MKKFKIRLLAALILLLALGVFILIAYGFPIFTFEFVGYSRDWLSSKLHISKHFITALSFVLAFGLYYVVRDLVSFNRKKQRRGLLIYFSFMVIFYVFLGMVEKDWSFEANTGKANFGFVRNENGLLDSVPLTTYNPKNGTKVLPATPELIYEWKNQQNKIHPVERVVPTDSSIFFVYGEPVLWYFMRSNGKIELYNHPGKHPHFQNVQLNPINDSVAKLILKYLENGQDSMFIGNTKKKKGNYVGKETESLSEFLKSLSKKTSN